MLEQARILRYSTPKDQWEDCVKFMRKRIEQGKVPGIKKSAKAEKMVR